MVSLNLSTETAGNPVTLRNTDLAATTVLITGGAGFIGLNLSERLLEKGATVISFGLTRPPDRAISRFASIPGNYSIEIGDILDYPALISAIETHRATHLINCAAITAGLKREKAQAEAIVQVNLIGTLNILEAAVETGLKRVLQLSSGSVYGTAGRTIGGRPLEEDVDIPIPTSLYAITKYAAERSALRFCESHHLDVIVARLPVVFGRWEHDTGVRDSLSLPFLLTRIAQRGGTARLPAVLPDDWLYASDAADALLALLYARAPHHTLYHLGNGYKGSAASWCAQLASAYPRFSYEWIADSDQTNLDVDLPAARAPLSIRRMNEEFGCGPRFDIRSAFADYQAWLDQTGPGG